MKLFFLQPLLQPSEADSIGSSLIARVTPVDNYDALHEYFSNPPDNTIQVTLIVVFLLLLLLLMIFRRRITGGRPKTHKHHHMIS